MKNISGRTERRVHHINERPSASNVETDIGHGFLDRRSLIRDVCCALFKGG